MSHEKSVFHVRSVLLSGFVRGMLSPMAKRLLGVIVCRPVSARRPGPGRRSNTSCRSRRRSIAGCRSRRGSRTCRPARCSCGWRAPRRAATRFTSLPRTCSTWRSPTARASRSPRRGPIRISGTSPATTARSSSPTKSSAIAPTAPTSASTTCTRTSTFPPR